MVETKKLALKNPKNDMLVNTAKTKELVIGRWDHQSNSLYYLPKMDLSKGSLSLNSWVFMWIQTFLGKSTSNMLLPKPPNGYIFLKFLSAQAFHTNTYYTITPQ